MNTSLINKYMYVSYCQYLYEYIIINCLHRCRAIIQYLHYYKYVVSTYNKINYYHLFFYILVRV